MKTKFKITIVLLICLCISGLIAKIVSGKANVAIQNEIIKANIEALADNGDGEDCWPKKVGSHSEKCGHIMTDGTHCNRTKILCDNYNNNGCSPSPCPVHP